VHWQIPTKKTFSVVMDGIAKAGHVVVSFGVLYNLVGLDRFHVTRIVNGRYSSMRYLHN
jgi:hypothetical protein